LAKLQSQLLLSVLTKIFFYHC